jgi:GNAT superfamily N-acetyltransferase
MTDIRPLRSDDLGWVPPLANAAFCRIQEILYGRPRTPPVFPPHQFPYRLAVDPEGCFAAVDGGRPVGVLFSVARGPLAWVGPIAVAPDADNRGIGQALVGVCLDAWTRRSVQLAGLETFATSPKHLHLYAKFGFRPGWTGVSMRKEWPPAPPETSGRAAAVSAPDWPDGVSTTDDPPPLDFVYPGLDLRAEIETTRRQELGELLVTDGGCALCHVRSTFHPRPGSTFVPFASARDAAAFDRLLRAAECLAARAGCHALSLRLPGSCWDAYRHLAARGYRDMGAMVRMKRGERLDYDHAGLFYCDNWL